MNKPLWPCMQPKEAAAELLRSCAWEMGGNTGEAAHKAAYYLFQELIAQLGADHPRARELAAQIASDPTSPEAGKLQTTMVLANSDLGRRRAARIFQHFGRPVTKTRRIEMANHGLLLSLDIMKPKPIVHRLAKQLAEENKKLPRAQQRGAGSTSVRALEKHIRDLEKKRAAGIKNGTWWGPVRV
jgi:hypothetical protein